MKGVIMPSPISGVNSAARLQNWARSRIQPAQDTPGAPRKDLPDSTQDAMLQAVKEATFEGLHRRGYVNHSMSRAKIIRTFLGLDDGGRPLNADNASILGVIKDSAREGLRATGYIDHTTPRAEVMRILLELDPHADEETGFEMAVPIAIAIAELCAALIQKDGFGAIQAHDEVTLEVLQ